MSVSARIAAVAVAAATLLPGSAHAATGDYCVAMTRPDCTPAATLVAALAQPDRVRVYVGQGSFPADVDDDGTPVQIIGAGIDDTVLGELDLTSSGSTVTLASLDGRLHLAGRAERVEARHGVDLLPGATGTTAQLAQADVEDGVIATGPAQLDDVVLDAPAARPAALDVTCAPVLARQLTIDAAAPHAVRAACATAGQTAMVSIRNSVLDGTDPVTAATGGTVVTAFSEHAADPDATATDRLQPGAGLVDAGDPEPLAEFEPFEDVDGDPRVTDGNGDGVVRRDVGAQELQPPATPLPAGNVLVNPGAEDAVVIPGAPPPGWSGTFAVATYGDPSLPGKGAAAALGGGTSFFSAADAATADLLQRIDLSASARAIDDGGASAALQALLGGYGNDADVVRLTADFRDPEGNVLGELALGPVTPAERGNSTNLLLRAASAAIPPRTRAIDVTIHGERRAGTYTDAYADDVSLVLSVPGVPVDPPVLPTDPIVPGLKPFSGVSVLTARPTFSKHWRSAIVVACPSATIGRCSGTLELLVRLPRAPRRTRVAHYAYFSIAPGASRSIRLRMLLAARRVLKPRKSVSARLLTVARDTQGLQRARTVPLTLRLPKGAARKR